MRTKGRLVADVAPPPMSPLAEYARERAANLPALAEITNDGVARILSDFSVPARVDLGMLTTYIRIATWSVRTHLALSLRSESPTALRRQLEVAKRTGQNFVSALEGLGAFASHMIDYIAIVENPNSIEALAYKADGPYEDLLGLPARVKRMVATLDRALAQAERPAKNRRYRQTYDRADRVGFAKALSIAFEAAYGQEPRINNWPSGTAARNIRATSWEDFYRRVVRYVLGGKFAGPDEVGVLKAVQKMSAEQRDLFADLFGIE